MKKIIIVVNILPHYRVPFFNLLSKYCKLTIIHSGSNVCGKLDFNQIILRKINLGPFVFQKNLKSTLDSINYDEIVFMFDLWWLSNYKFFFKKNKFYLWGNRYSKFSFVNKIREYFMLKAKGNILYSKCDLEKMKNAGINENKIFVAHNTIYNKNKTVMKSKKYNLLFVGRLQKRKKINDLITFFHNNLNTIDKSIKVDIIGDGPELLSLKNLTKKLELSHRIIFHGKIHDENKLKKYFENALIYISPGPVGLGVLHSFSYGVPVVTQKIGKHGPELSNIIDGFNGFVCDDFKDFSSKINSLLGNKFLLKKMSINAYNFYTYSRNISIMVSGFTSALNLNN